MKDLALHELALLYTFGPVPRHRRPALCTEQRAGEEHFMGGGCPYPHPGSLSSRPVNLWLEALILVPNDAQEISSKTRAYPRVRSPVGNKAVHRLRLCRNSGDPGPRGPWCGLDRGFCGISERGRVGEPQEDFLEKESLGRKAIAPEGGAARTRAS